MRNIKRLFDIVDRSIFRVDSDLGYDRTLSALCRLADCIDNADDVDWFLGECGSCSLDSLMVGAYWYCVHYHSGQASVEYALQCGISEFFSPNATSLERDSSEFDVYVGLAVLAGHGEWDDIVNSYNEEG